MPHPLDSDAVRDWCALALQALGEGRAEIDAINVFPVADGDTGTNLHRTLAEASRALAGQPDAPDPLAVLARAALLGACGNSGTILAQLLYGMTESAPGDTAHTGAGARLALALRRAADSAYQAVAHPVEGTMLTVASAAADAAERAAASGGGPVTVAEAAHEAARLALAATTSQLPVLARASVVDAGAQGLTLILGALPRALKSRGGSAGISTEGCTDVVGRPGEGARPGEAAAGEGLPRERDGGSPEYEVMYLLDARPSDIPALRDALDALPGADSLVIGGAHALWSIHLHTDDAGGAIEAGIAVGHPHRIRINHLAAAPASAPDSRALHSSAPGAVTPETVAPGSGTPRTGTPEIGTAAAGTPETGTPQSRTPEIDSAEAITETRAPEISAPETAAQAASRGSRAIVAVVPGDGLAGLCEEAGATVVRAPSDPSSGETVDTAALLDALRRTHAQEAVLLPNDPDLRATAAHAAGMARAEGVRVAVIPTRAAVQGIAALAVHEPGRDFDEDVVSMTAAAGATRYGEVAFAERQSWTMAGICQAGDVLGLVDGDVAVIGTDIEQAATDVVERMLAAGGEMVTLVVGAGAPADLADRLDSHVRRAHLAVDTVVYEGRQRSSLLLVGVE